MPVEKQKSVDSSTLITLLNEYTKKLTMYSSQLKPPFNSRSEFSKSSYLKLLSAATKLASYTSQLIEHASLDDITRYELTLRLAEFEIALDEFEGQLK